MRVLLLNQYYAPDEAPTARLLADLAVELVHRGHQVRVVCSQRDYADPERRYASRETIDGVEVRRVPATGFGRASSLARLVDWATFLPGAGLAAVAGPRPDLVVALTTPPLVGLVGWVAARARSVPLLYWVMDVYPDVAFALGALRRHSPAGLVMSALSRFLLRRVDHVVALGETMAARLRAQGASEVSVVHNWADGAAIQPLSREDHPLRKAWGWEGRFVVMHSGNLGLAYEFETAIDAAERLRERTDVLFAFVGGGPREAEVREAAARRNLTNVEFRPWVEMERLGQSLTAGDIHLVTLREGVAGLLVPSKLYGILAAGRPALYVGPAEGEVAAIIAEGGCGTRIAPGDGAALAREIERYASDSARCDDEGRRARRLFEQRFSRHDALASLGDLIERLASSR